jgi:aldehyde dehydrogenase (NAD+)
MKTYEQFYINGEWVDPVEELNICEVLNPANEEVIGKVAMGSAADVDRAVIAARDAFDTYSQTSVEERLALLGKIVEVYQQKAEL